jgi:membrane-bound inhibitor of C-type lysozyme
MRHLNLLAAAPALALAAFALAGCEPKAETFNDTTTDPQAAALANAAPVELPPMLKLSKQYRCKDNSLIFIDFMTDDKTANVKSAKDGPVTVLKAAEAGQPYKSQDGAKTIAGQGETITYNGQSCKAG